MKMMPAGPKLCCHHGLAGHSLALREGDHTMGQVLLTMRHGTMYIYIYLSMYTYVYMVHAPKDLPFWRFSILGSWSQF